MKNIALSILLLLSMQLNAVTITIGTGGDFATLSAAESAINAGDTIMLLDQTFSNGSQFLNDINGTASQPVVIMAANMHQAIFQGGTEGIHLINCNYVEINGLVFEQQTGNGVNIDDGGDYTTPSTNITVRNCIFRDIGSTGNRDFLKMSGVDDFLIENCSFSNGSEGSGVDFVGCHNGIVQDCFFENTGNSGVQCKGGTQFITIRRNRFKDIYQRALNLGGSTGLQFFRPALPDPIVDAFEAADLDVYANIFVGSRAPIAYVGCVRVNVFNNTIYMPDNWVIRILQETTEPGFLTCANNEFSNNIVFLETDKTEVNIGPNTDPNSFVFSNNLWFNESSSNWTPNLPVADPNQLIGNPLFTNASSEDFTLQANSPAIGAGVSNLAPDQDFSQMPFSNPPSIGAHEGNPVTNIADFESRSIDVKAYPNPSMGTFYINLESLEESAQYSLLDMYGRTIVPSKQIHEKSLKLELEGSPGMYLLILETQSAKKVFRLIKH